MSFTPPKRSERKICWSHRDEYYQCLDKQNIQNPQNDNSKQCAQLKETYEKTCPNTWVQHFNDLRVSAFKQKEFLESLQKSK